MSIHTMLRDAVLLLKFYREADAMKRNATARAHEPASVEHDSPRQPPGGQVSKKNGAARAEQPAKKERAEASGPGRFTIYTDEDFGVEIRSYAHAMNISAREFFEEAARRYIANLKRAGITPFLKVHRLKPGRPLRVKR